MLRAAETGVFRQLALLVCPLNASLVPARTTCHARLALTNSGGNHLSSDEAPLPVLQRNLAIAVGVLLALWALNWLRWRAVRNAGWVGLLFFFDFMH